MKDNVRNRQEAVEKVKEKFRSQAEVLGQKLGPMMEGLSVTRSDVQGDAERSQLWEIAQFFPESNRVAIVRAEGGSESSQQPIEVGLESVVLNPEAGSSGGGGFPGEGGKDEEAKGAGKGGSKDE